MLLKLKSYSVKYYALLALVFSIACSEESFAPKLSNTEAILSEENEEYNEDRAIGLIENHGGGTSTGGGIGPLSTGISNRFQIFYRENSQSSIIRTFYSDRPTEQGDWSIIRHARGQTETMITSSQYKNRLFVAYRGQSSSKLWYTSSLDGRDFTPNKPLESGARTSGSIDMVVFKNKLWLYHRGATQSKIYYNQLPSPLATTWIGNAPIGGTAASIIGRFSSFDFIPKGDTLFHIGGGSAFMFVSYSVDGKNFSDFARILLPAPDLQDITHVEHRGIDFMLVGTGSKLNRDLYWYDGRDFTQPRRIRINGQAVSVKNDASIASDGSRLVLSYQEQTGRRIQFAYSDDDGVTWFGGGTTHPSFTPAPTTNKSGLEIIYTRQ